MIDRVVTDRYRVTQQIGIGGMGIVYRAHDTKLRRDVALKVIAPHLVQDEDARLRFLREAQALAGLAHPNIVTVYDLAEDPETGNVFIVMELLNGAPLRRRITDPNRPGFAQMASQVCRALECAHSHGILHRDIKPENIFVCDDGTIKLMDFGLARLVDSTNVSQSGMVTGTVAYMAPEQLRGGALDARTDLYALGVLFYEYICGITPFAAESPGTVLLKHLTEQPPSLRVRVPGVSAELEALIMRLLAKDPAGRYPSAMILRDALENLRSGSNSAAPSVGSKSGTPSIPIVVPNSKPGNRKRIPLPLRRAPRNLFRIAFVMTMALAAIIVAICFGQALRDPLEKWFPAIFKANDQVVQKTTQAKQPPKSGSPAKKGVGRKPDKSRRPKYNSSSDVARPDENKNKPETKGPESDGSSGTKSNSNPYDGSEPEKSDGGDPPAKSDSNDTTDSSG